MTHVSCGTPVWMAAALLCAVPHTALAQTPTHAISFADQILAPDAGGTEREQAFEARPEVFLQVRLAASALPGAESDEGSSGFRLSRLETRWSGRLTDHVGAGVEFQWQPALHGATDELVNDAFVEFYATRALTIRAGQFVKPFGFDVMQSSTEREYPERGMFAGYFFPGQRDRGVMARWERQTPSTSAGPTQVYAALLNGNRFWDDNDGRFDLVLRVRQALARRRFALGASTQVGSQLVPPGVVASTRVRIAGLDAQVALGAVGLRLEWVHGTRPSTLLSRMPEYTAAFAADTTTSGVAIAAIARVRPAAEAFLRVDQLSGDPMTGDRVRAVDAGYRMALDSRTHLSLDGQWKSGASTNDDAVNTRIQASLGIVF